MKFPSVFYGIVFVLLFKNITAASYNTQFVEEIQMRDYICSASTTDIGGTRSVTHCGKKCSSSASCKTFFYNSQLQTCSISPVMYDSTSGCLAETGTKYYRKNESVFGIACITDSECWMSNMVCLDGICKCVLGYVYDQRTGKCIETCATYGTSYSLYYNTKVDASVTILYGITSLQECLDQCSASATCRGVNFCCLTTTPGCRLIDGTPLTNPEKVIIPASGKEYHIRNCE